MRRQVHVANVVYNSLFLGEIVQPDWDMFQSEHPAAGLHAAARAVGGCAVYTSDRPGVHDFALLRKLVLPDGSILRALLPGPPPPPPFRPMLRFPRPSRSES